MNSSCTNKFCVKIKIKNLESNYQNLNWFMSYNLCKFFYNKKKKSSDFFFRDIRCKGLRLDLERTYLIFTDLLGLDQTATFSRTWNSDFLVVSRFNCFDSSRLEFLIAWISAKFQSFSSLGDYSYESPELSIYRAQKGSL